MNSLEEWLAAPVGSKREPGAPLVAAPSQAIYGKAMRLDLSDLHTKTLNLRLSPQDAGEEQKKYVRILETRGLAGSLEAEPGSLRISEMQAQSAVLDALRLLFGTLVLSAQGETILAGVVADYASSDERFEMNLCMDTLQSAALRVEVGTIKVQAGLNLQQGRVGVTSDGGRIEAGSCIFSNFHLEIAGVQLKAAELRVEKLAIVWGDSGFDLHAEDVTSAVFEFIVEGASATLQGLQAGQLNVHDADWSIKKVLLQSAQVRLVPTAANPDSNTESSSGADAAEQSATHKGEGPLFAWNLLDTLNGHVNVDLGVELKVPVIQKRNAVHHFRVPIQNGKVNFRELESNLAMPEDLLLDFSVRDAELVLELGIPFLPTRGHGKRLVRWPLPPEEHALALGHLIRLATFAQPQVVIGETNRPPPALPAAPTSQEEEPVRRGASSSATPSANESLAVPGESIPPPSKRGALEQLALRNIEVDVTLSKPSARQEAQLKTLQIGALKVHGDVVHQTTGESERTSVHGSLTDVLFSLDDFPFAGRKFDLNQIVLEGSSQFKVDLENLKVLDCSCELGPLRATSIDFGIYAEGDVGL